MATIERFEDIEAWRKARELAQSVYRATGAGAFARDYGLRDQMRRAAVSVMSNIAEGFERGGNRELAHFLAVAKGSAGELRAQLYVALDAAYLSEQQFADLMDLALQTSRLVAGLMRYLAQAEYRGSRHTGGVAEAPGLYPDENDDGNLEPWTHDLEP